MTVERHSFTLRTANPPTIEWDSEADALYVRFSRRSVARTVDQNAQKMNIAIDLDAQGQVVGIEAIGMTSFTLRQILQAAKVEAPKVDLSEARFVSVKAAA